MSVSWVWFWVLAGVSFIAGAGLVFALWLFRVRESEWRCGCLMCEAEREASRRRVDDAEAALDAELDRLLGDR